MAADLAEILRTLRAQLAKRENGMTLRTLGLTFEVNDQDHRGYLDFDEFEQCLARAGLFLKRQELTKLFKYFDREGTARITYSEFLRGLAPPPNERRTALIKAAFQKLDKLNHGVVDIADVAASYDASKHPQVLNGQKTVEQVETEWLEGFKEAAGKTMPGVVTFAEWLDYYTGISASCVEDDYFVLVLSKAWGIQESGHDGSDVSKATLEQVRATLREKCRQKAGSKQGNEAEILRRAFRFVDQEESGYLMQANFLMALERFGVVLEERVGRALFVASDPAGAGRIKYADFCTDLYRNQAGSGAETKVTATQQRPLSATQPVTGAAAPAPAAVAAKPLPAQPVKPATPAGGAAASRPAAAPGHA